MEICFENETIDIDTPFQEGTVIYLSKAAFNKAAEEDGTMLFDEYFENYSDSEEEEKDTRHWATIKAEKDALALTRAYDKYAKCLLEKHKNDCWYDLDTEMSEAASDTARRVTLGAIKASGRKKIFYTFFDKHMYVHVKRSF
jgi:hypothetical protein